MSALLCFDGPVDQAVPIPEFSYAPGAPKGRSVEELVHHLHCFGALNDAVVSDHMRSGVAVAWQGSAVLNAFL
ncbi:hypothetical protein Rhow_002358 [Rhodococcus wratislaviensis]|uniref:Uncharacterized protein n=1 Tax=Rhodococcus wratislaviensis TaxID=44752 RepID=A0A402C5B1_RHOWR|nr:hypothetical protein Rhow_002358 [Rhodococcus wratislaviensis]